MWLPWFENINMENREKCKQTEKSDVLRIIPNKNFSFKRNPYTDHINAFLFEGPKKFAMKTFLKIRIVAVIVPQGLTLKISKMKNEVLKKHPDP